MEVQKLKREIKYDYSNRFIKFIYDKLEGSLNGDWSEYDEGEEVNYNYDIGDDDWSMIDFSYNSLKEFIGEGITIVEDDIIFYNIELKDFILNNSFNYIDERNF
jgi:hypothetical protein